MDDEAEGTTSGQRKLTHHTQWQQGSFPSQKKTELR